MKIFEVLTEITPKKEWSGKYSRMYKLLRSKAVLLSSLRGFNKPDDLDFLKQLNDLRTLRIEFYGKTLKNVEAISELNNLEELDLGAKISGHVDLSCLEKLKKASIVDCVGVRSIFDNQAVEQLSIINFDGSDLRALIGMNNLEKLSLYNPKKLSSLAGVKNLNKLNKIEITSENQRHKIDFANIDLSGYEGELVEG